MTQTIFRQSHSLGGAHIVLGDLVHVNSRTTWHSKDLLFDLFFQHGTGLMSSQSLIRLMLKSREALINAHITEGLDR